MIKQNYKFVNYVKYCKNCDITQNIVAKFSKFSMERKVSVNLVDFVMKNTQFCSSYDSINRCWYDTILKMTWKQMVNESISIYKMTNVTSVVE